MLRRKPFLQSARHVRDGLDQHPSPRRRGRYDGHRGRHPRRRLGDGPARRGRRDVLHRRTYAVGIHPYQTVVSDSDGDGHPDLATADFGGAQVSILLNNGDGSFGAATALEVSEAPRALAAGDLDGDGTTDVLVSSLKGNSVALFQGSETGELTQFAELSATGAYDAAAADLDGDGVRDIAVANSSAGQVDVFKGACS
ncbi:FG-GAP repeat domain-containing protein [Streptomyces sp. NPDC060065]|uniref:FG-GAP repeat domain-containing protein n=1 Tax=Streptomyces sp. NPDC060065 TaxID=3347050 RepID=UPI0036873C4C